MVKRAGVVAACLAAAMLVFPACETVKEHEKTAIGTGVGAAGGAVIGGVAGGKKGAVIGGLLGALAGGAVGYYLETQDKDSDETNREQGYEPSQGIRINIVSSAAEPSKVTPGDKVDLAASFAVMAPDATQMIAVTENRVVTLNGVKVADTIVTNDRTPGTYTTKISITLPDTAAAGKYTYTITVSGGGQTATKSAVFTVGS